MCNITMTVIMSLISPLTPPAEFDTYVLRNNDVVQARVISVEGDRVRMEVPLGNGSAEVRRPIADFTPASTFRIVAAASPPPETADDHLRLASVAASNELIGAANVELNAARKLAEDPMVGAAVESRIASQSAVVMETMVRERIKAKDPAGARRAIDELVARYPDSEPASRKPELLADVSRLEADLQAARQQDAAMKAAQKRQKTLDTIHQKLQAGDEVNRKGLLSSRNVPEARRLFLTAAGLYESGLKTAEKFATEEPQVEPGVTGSHATHELVKQARTSTAGALLNAASLYLIQSQHRQALTQVNHALAVDPQNREAKDMRARIEVAANEPLLLGGGRFGR